jgi:mannan endo-1,4-beta-mannosidase
MKKLISMAIIAAMCMMMFAVNIAATESSDGLGAEQSDGLGAEQSDTGATDPTKFNFGPGAGNPETFVADGITGYVAKEANQIITATVTVETAGMYTLYVHCFGPDTAKQVNVNVNGVTAATIEAPKDMWAEVPVMANLTAGENIVDLVPNWTWYVSDYVRVEAATLPEITGSSKLANPNATAETQGLMNYLASIYTKNILSGQQEIYMWGPHDFEYEFEWLLETTGKLPAIRAFDFLNYSSPCLGANIDEFYNLGYDDGTVDRMIDWTNNKNGIVSASWHLTVPKDFAGYTLGDRVEHEFTTYKNNESDFVAANVYVDGTKENKYYNTALDKLAGGLQKLEDAKVPVIWRPLHEAQGQWFWWSGEGPEVFVELWKYTYDYLVNEKGFDNLIWEWNGYPQSGNELWYPGDDYVDLVAYDKYNAQNNTPNESAISSTFYDLADVFGQKMIAMSENDTVPSLKNLVDSKAYWLYFCPWYESEGAPFLTKMNDPNTLSELYNSEYCITIDELPDWKSFAGGEQPAETEKGDVNEDGSIDLADFVLVKKFVLGADAPLSADNADINEDGKLNSIDISILLNILLTSSE